MVFGEPNADRGTWALGRVEEIYDGPDGVARSARLKTPAGFLHRPVSRLAVVEVSSTGEAQDVADSP